MFSRIFKSYHQSAIELILLICSWAEWVNKTKHEIPRDKTNEMKHEIKDTDQYLLSVGDFGFYRTVKTLIGLRDAQADQRLH